MRIAFAMESLRFSGGHQVVVEHAKQLVEHHGFEVSLIDCFGNATSHWDFTLPDDVRVEPLDTLGDEIFDVAVATWWSTIAMVSRIPARTYACFVQSLDDRGFSDDQPESTLARLALDLGLPVITEATWIAELMRHRYPAKQCVLVRNGIDKSVFPLGTDRTLRGQGPLQVLVEAGTGHTTTKGVPEALAALGMLSEPTHTTIVGDVGGLVVPSGTTTVPVVPQRELSELYATHDVLLKTSRVEGMYGPPLEAFHRGSTVVTTPVTGHDEFVVHGHNALVVDWDDPVGTARALDLLNRDRDLLERLRTGALDTARGWQSWNDSGTEMAGAIKTIAADEPDSLSLTLPIYLGADRFAFETAMRTHSLKVTLEAADDHIEKLEYAWHLSEEARERTNEDIRALQASNHQLEATSERLTTELTLTRATADAVTAHNAVLQAQVDMRVEARIARVARRIRDRMLGR